MAVLLDQKCPNCGSSIGFDTESQNMTCPHCQAEFDVQALQKAAELKTEEKPHVINWESDGAPWREEETQNLAVYMCCSCGGKIITDKTTGATSCPYCDNSVIVKSHFSGDFKPDTIIPFKLDKEQAMEALRKHVNSSKYIPALFRDENRIKEIKGVYVPHWLFSGKGSASASYSAETMRSWHSGDYTYTETNHYSVFRAGNFEFANIPVDGSAKMDDTLMESLEPFDTAECVPFSTGYLMGYFADKYDVTAQQSIDRANERISNSINSALRSTVVGYHRVNPSEPVVNMEQGNYKYALYPVWLLTTSWEGKNYIFAMNGQTGKFIGDLPLDKKKFYKHLALWSALLSVIAYIVLFFIAPFFEEGLFL